MNNRVKYIGPSVATDKEILFLQEILVVADHADPENTVTIYRKPDEIIVHITPSNMDFRQRLVDNLLYFNRTKQARLRFSSSLKISKIISFTVNLQESMLSANLEA